MRVTKNSVATWATISNDWNPIHFDPAHGAQFGFKQVIAHGMLSMLPAKHAIYAKFGLANPICCRFRMREPVTVPSVLEVELEDGRFGQVIDAATNSSKITWDILTPEFLPEPLRGEVFSKALAENDTEISNVTSGLKQLLDADIPAPLLFETLAFRRVLSTIGHFDTYIKTQPETVEPEKSSAAVHATHKISWYAPNQPVLRVSDCIVRFGLSSTTSRGGTVSAHVLHDDRLIFWYNAGIRLL